MGQPAAEEDLSAYLRDLKHRTGRSYDALARRLGVSSSALHRYCTSTGMPPPFAVLERFAIECGATRGELAELRRRWLLITSGPSADGRTPDRDGAADVPPPQGEVSARLATPSTKPAAAEAGRRTTHKWGRWAFVPIGLLLAAAVLYAADSWREADATASSTVPQNCVARTGVRHLDDQLGGRTWTTDFVCPNRVEAPLYLSPTSSLRVAVMDTPKSWYVCWSLGRSQADGGTVWYYTRGDRAEPGASRWAGWGFIASADVNASRHPWPEMPRCVFDPAALAAREPTQTSTRQTPKNFRGG